MDGTVPRENGCSGSRATCHTPAEVRQLVGAGNAGQPRWD